MNNSYLIIKTIIFLLITGAIAALFLAVAEADRRGLSAMLEPVTALYVAVALAFVAGFVIGAAAWCVGSICFSGSLRKRHAGRNLHAD